MDQYDVEEIHVFGTKKKKKKKKKKRFPCDSVSEDALAFECSLSPVSHMYVFIAVRSDPPKHNVPLSRLNKDDAARQ